MFNDRCIYIARQSIIIHVCIWRCNSTETVVFSEARNFLRGRAE